MGSKKINRIPSIHIREDILTQVLSSLSTKYNIKQNSIELLAKDIAIACKPYSSTHRKVEVRDTKLLNKATRVGSSNLKGAMLFNKLLTLSRQKLKHVGVVPLTPDHRDWPVLKNLVELANQFAVEFQLEEKIAYTEYIRIGLSKMQRFALPKLLGLHSAICSEYEAQLALQMDKTPGETEEAYLVYSTIIAKKTGIGDMGYKNIPEKYATFIKIKEEANDLGLSVKQYVTAQFEAFSFRDGVPDPLQMVGPKARGRAIKYCFENNISLKTKPTINFKNIKNG